MDNKFIEHLIMKAQKNIRKAAIEIGAIGQNNKKDITHFINVCHSMGKYHAYMDILKDFSMDDFIKCNERNKEYVNKALDGVEKLYKIV